MGVPVEGDMVLLECVEILRRTGLARSKGLIYRSSFGEEQSEQVGSFICLFKYRATFHHNSKSLP